MLVEYLNGLSDKDIDKNISRFGDENISFIRSKLIKRRNENARDLIKTQVKALQSSESISSQIIAVSEFKKSVLQGEYNEILDPYCEQRKDLEDFIRNEIEFLELKNRPANDTNMEAVNVEDIPMVDAEAEVELTNPTLIFWEGSDDQLYELVNQLIEKRYIVNTTGASMLITGHFCKSNSDLFDKVQICEYFNETNDDQVQDQIEPIRWTKASTQLCYLIAQLIDNQFLPLDMNKGATIADHFCTRTGSSYNNRTLNQVYSNLKDNSDGKCQGSENIDIIIRELL